MTRLLLLTGLLVAPLALAVGPTDDSGQVVSHCEPGRDAVRNAVHGIDWRDALNQGIRYRERGHITLSVRALAAAESAASDDRARAQAAGELGVSQFRAGDFDQAKCNLKKAYDFFSGTARAPYAIDLGNVAFAQRSPDEAQDYYEKALSLAGKNQVQRLTAQLNLARARLLANEESMAQLTELAAQIEVVNDARIRASFHLNLGVLALRMVTDGRRDQQNGGPQSLEAQQTQGIVNQGTELAYVQLEQARQLAQQRGEQRLLIEALDALSELYVENGRPESALALADRAVALAEAMPRDSADDLLVGVELRRGRLFRQAGDRELALLAYERAARHIAAVRQDLPIKDVDGTPTFKSTLQPVYMGLVELGLQLADEQCTEEDEKQALSRVRDALELLRQSEMQDYLGDRCTVDTIRDESAAAGVPKKVPEKTGILYPILLQDHVELVLETSNGFERRKVYVRAKTVEAEAALFAGLLRAEDSNSKQLMVSAKALYQWLLAPLKAIADGKIHTLVVASDGPLRLLPFGALHDGQKFLVEKVAVATVTGMSMTSTSASRGRALVALIAGVARPGAAVQKLDPATVYRVLGEPPDPRCATVSGCANQWSKLHQRLSLPGVTAEVNKLKPMLSGTAMLDSAFTKRRFEEEAGSGRYSVVHIASHGFFESDVNNSFILAHNDLLRLDQLERAVQSSMLQSAPLELLSLSACNTAAGSDRAPLGMSGAAMKARARSVLGTLWRVRDDVAVTVMVNFYRGLANEGLSKAEALRQAQLKLIQPANSLFKAPYYWAPFVLIGNWQ